MNNEVVNIDIKRFRPQAIMPTRGSDLAAGFDLCACLNESIKIEPGKMAPISTGLNIRIPAGYEVQIRPRSGLAYKHCITVQNSPGTIDADYDGDGEAYDVKVMLRNEGDTAFTVNHGDRIAQMVVNKLPAVTLNEVFGDNQNRNESNRKGGLGSTGV